MGEAVEVDDAIGVPGGPDPLGPVERQLYRDAVGPA